MKLKKVLFAGLAAALAVSGIGKAGAWEEVGIFQLMECSKGEHCAIYRFSDLLADECINYHHIGVEYCLDNGIMNGTSETTFRHWNRLRVHSLRPYSTVLPVHLL